MKHDSFNESAEMYLKTVSELAVNEGPVPISALAGRLGVSTVSATEMVHRLQDHGLVEHQPYKGICLTECGYRQASEVIRSHRLWERFLADDLGLAWDEVHSLACRLEHATDPKVTEALDAYLGYPATCPHGNPIPRHHSTPSEPEDCPLTELRPGDSAVITRVHPESDELLEYLADLELVTGTYVSLFEVVPFNGPLVFKERERTVYLGLEAAALVFCKPVEEA
ncbi:MAG: metal-dependent transcriptional regulator [Anaerolineae bacterium]|nr:metal-dependent transcriptional regulator [Anaerolineae bacterium]